MKTEIIAILDRSGSMSSTVTEAIGGFNAFIAKQRTEPGEAKLSLVLFDNEYILAYAGKDMPLVDDLNKDTYVPRGATALNDAIGRTLHEQGERIKREAWADKVIVCVVTDGFENASKEWTQDGVRALVKEKEALGWSFAFLFSNLSEQVAKNTTVGYGVNLQSANNVMRSFSGGAAGQSLSSSYDALNATVSNVRGGKKADGS